MVRVAVIIYNTHFSVKVLDMSIHEIVRRLCDELTTYTYEVTGFNHSKYGKKPQYTKVKDREFFSFIKQTNTYRFPISTNRNFLLLLGNNGVKRDEISIQMDREYEMNKLSLSMNPDFIPRDYQDRYINALVSDAAKALTLVDLRMGYGKTLIILSAIVKRDLKLGILIVPKYIDKTVLDIKKYMRVKDEDILVIQGSENLIDLMNNPKNDYKIIIFAMRTIYNYIESYENNDFNYPVLPIDLLRSLGIGILFSDESHQEFYALFKALLHMDVRYVIGSTATFETSDSYINKMYETLFPMLNRISNLVEYKKYLNVFAIQYEFNSMRGIQFKRAKGYNQILFEQSIMRNNILLRSYLEMIDYFVIEGYFKRKEPGDKMLIFAGSINMCTLITNYLANKFRMLDVRRYVETDNFKNVLEADICVATALKAGTAVDIPDLITVLQTISMSSMQANEQNAGRLREIPGKEMRYYYLYCKNIKQHHSHHVDRKQAISKLAITYNHDDYRVRLRVK